MYVVANRLGAKVWDVSLDNLRTKVRDLELELEIEKIILAQ